MGKKVAPHGQKHDNMVVKNIASFVKSEYKAKKPKEIRLIRLKPQITFKKGTLLPNLLIKSLQTTRFVVYVDYIDEVRFYYYDQHGTSMGGASYPKSKGLLDEMKGNGKTLYRLPKPDIISKLESESVQIRKYQEKRLPQLIHQFGNSTTTTTMKSIELLVSKYPESKIEKKSDRIGVNIIKNKNYLHKTYFDNGLYKMILDRELLSNLFSNKTSTKQQPIITVIATIIAFLDSKYTTLDVNKYLKIWKGQNSPTKLNFKLKEWIEKKLLKIKREPKKTQKIVQNNIFSSILSLLQINYYKNNNIWQLFGIWLMKKDIISLKSQEPYAMGKEIGELLFNSYMLWKKFDIPIKDKNITLEIWTAYFLYSIYSSDINQIQYPDVSTFPFLKNTIDQFKSAEKEIEQLNLTLAYNTLQEICKSTQATEFQYNMLENLFFKKGLQITTPDTILVPIGENTKFTVELKNNSDWILYDLKYMVKITPPNRADIDFETTIRTKVFDIKQQLPISVIGKNKGNATISIFIEYIPNNQDIIKPLIKQIIQIPAQIITLIVIPQL